MSNAALPSQANRLAEWRNGWQLVLACFVGAILAGIALNTVGVFMGPLSEEFGWSSAEITAAVPINGWLIAFTAPLVGGLMDRVGARRVGLIGCVALPVAIASLGFISGSIWTYWAGWGLIAVAQITANILIWTMPVAGRFIASRGTALAIVLMGNSAAGILYPPIATMLIADFGWRAAYIITGAGLLALCLPVVWLFFYDRRDIVRAGKAPLEAGNTADGPQVVLLPGMSAREALRTRHFWQFLAAIVLGAGSAVTMFIHIIPMSTAAGLSRIEAATVASAFGISTLVVKIIVGPVVDRMRAPPLAALTMLCPIISCLIFMGAQDDIGLGWAILAAVLSGVGTGAELDMIGVLAARMFGVANYGRIYGMSLTAFQLAIGSGPLIVSISFDRAQSYGPALVGLMICLFGSVLLLATLGRSVYEREPERFPPRPNAPRAAP
jgi:predicted MFS family arabinose efflux permease